MRSHLVLAQQLQSSYRDKQIISTANKENDSPASILNQTSIKDKIEVLIVEDNLVNIKIIKNFISSFPYNVTLANDGLDAVVIVNQRILKNPNKPPFDIIFMDQNMPRLTGDLAIKRIRGFVAKKGLKRIPIISISDVELNPEEQQARGVDEQMGKKLVPNKFIEMVEKYAKKSDTNCQQPAMDTIPRVSSSPSLFLTRHARKGVARLVMPSKSFETDIENETYLMGETASSHYRIMA